MPRYRLIFQDPEAFALHRQGGVEGSAHIDSGDTFYEVGDVIEHGGKRWSVSLAPLKQPSRSPSRPGSCRQGTARPLPPRRSPCGAA